MRICEYKSFKSLLTLIMQYSLINIICHLDNFKTLSQANTDIDRDSIIPESIRHKIMRDHGLTMRNAILMVMLSTFVIIVIFTFLILGMTLFAEGDAFSSAISSLLGATAGLVNILHSSRVDETKIARMATRLLETWASYSHNDTGVNLNDDLRDAVVRRSKYIQQQEKAQRAEESDVWITEELPVIVDDDDQTREEIDSQSFEDYDSLYS